MKKSKFALLERIFPGKVTQSDSEQQQKYNIFKIKIEIVNILMYIMINNASY
jgi:hypothetical protein